MPRRATVCAVLLTQLTESGVSFSLMAMQRNSRCSRRCRIEAVVLPPSASEHVSGPQTPEQNDVDEFEMNRGHAMDVLRADFQRFWEVPLDWGIYVPAVEIIDPSGFQLKGLTAYKVALGAIRIFASVACDNVQMMRNVFRYDAPRRVLESQWYSKWHLKGSTEPTYVSGVSHFFFDEKANVEKHLITQFLVNGKEVTNIGASIVQGLKNYVVAGAGCPRTNGGGLEISVSGPLLESGGVLEIGDGPLTTVLDATTDEAKPTVRPQQEKEPRAEATETKQKGGFMAKCEFMWDCEYPLECCDFVIGKACCGGGEGIPAFLRGFGDQQDTSPVPIPIPVPVGPPQP